MTCRRLLIRELAAAGVLVMVLCLGQSAMGQSVSIDSSTSIDQLKAMASQGNGDAMLELGERLVQGQGTAANVDEGLQWLTKATDAGEAQGWYDLGFVYANGLVGGKPDLAEAMKYFQKGADLGNADCQTSMGMFYQAGEKIPGGVKADPAQAVTWYRKAADQNHTEAIQHLAMLYAMGQGVTQDPAEATKWFRKGADLGNADCVWGLGQCYLSGKGVQTDTVMAYALFSASLDGVENPEQRAAMTALRDQLGKALTPDQLAKAAPIMKDWQSKVKK